MKTPSALKVKEAQLIRKAIQGKQEAYTTLYTLHRARLFSFIVHKMNNPDESEELVQETFIKAFKHLAKFKRTSTFSSWLHAIALNNIRMNLRAKHTLKYMRTCSLDNPLDTNTGNDEMTREFSQEDKVLCNSLARYDISRAVATLPRLLKDALTLKIQGYEHREVGRILGISTPASKARIYRAQLWLNAALISGHPLPKENKKFASILGPERPCIPVTKVFVKLRVKAKAVGKD